MWRRPIIPLTDEERDNHLFRIPDTSKFVLEMLSSLGPRSLTQPQMTTTDLAKMEKPSLPLKSEAEKTLPGLHVTLKDGQNSLQMVH